MFTELFESPLVLSSCSREYFKVLEESKLGSNLFQLIRKKNIKNKIIKKKVKQIKTLHSHIKKLQIENLHYKILLKNQVIPENKFPQNLKSEALLTLGYNSISDITSIKELTSRYKKLCHIYHPDSGGTQDSMKKLNQMFEYLKNQISS